MEKLVFFLDRDTKLTATEKTFINRLNQVLSIYNDLKDDLFRNDEKILDFEFIRALFDYASKADDLQLEFSNDLEIESELLIGDKQKIISVYNAPNSINMEINDFCNFIMENQISTIFVETTNNSYYNLFLDETIGDVNNGEDEQIVWGVLRKYIICYNNIIKKLNLDALKKKKYFCIFSNFAFGCVEQRCFYCLDENHIMSAIVIMCKDEINEKLVDYESIQEQKRKENEERLQREECERSRQTEIKIRRLEEKILNDENFAICRSEKERGTYLRGILEEESYDVITYLEMEQMLTGKVRARGIKWKQFINRLWERQNGKA